jgi:hypothetical protein
MSGIGVDWSSASLGSSASASCGCQSSGGGCGCADSSSSSPSSARMSVRGGGTGWGVGSSLWSGVKNPEPFSASSSSGGDGWWDYSEGTDVPEDNTPDTWYDCETPLCHPDNVGVCEKGGTEDEECLFEWLDLTPFPSWLNRGIRNKGWGVYSVEKGGCEKYEHLIKLAWCVLLSNKDIIINAMEYAGAGNMLLDGEESTEALLDCIEGNCPWNSLYSYLTEIPSSNSWFLEELLDQIFQIYRLRLACIDIGSVATQPDLQSPTVVIGTDYLDKLLGHFEDTKNYCADQAVKTQACVVCDLAATILHEMIHVIGLGWNDDDATETTEGVRAVAYVVENYFRYHVMKEYCVLGWGPCVFERDWNGEKISTSDVLLVSPYNEDGYTVEPDYPAKFKSTTC